MLGFAVSAALPTPQVIEERIRAVGAEATVRELWREPREWDLILAYVASGKVDWLKIATEMKPGADAGQSESLAIAVSRSIQQNPNAFLGVAFPVFGIRVCRDLSIEPSAKEHDAFQTKTREALKSVNGKRTSEARDACLRELGF
jgi:hypothetical protein